VMARCRPLKASGTMRITVSILSHSLSHRLSNSTRYKSYTGQ